VIERQGIQLLGRSFNEALLAKTWRGRTIKLRFSKEHKSESHNIREHLGALTLLHRRKVVSKRNPDSFWRWVAPQECNGDHITTKAAKNSELSVIVSSELRLRTRKFLSLPKAVHQRPANASRYLLPLLSQTYTPYTIKLHQVNDNFTKLSKITIERG